MSRALAMLVAAGVASTFAAAEERVLRIDPDSSTIAIVLGATLHKVRGSFELEPGAIRFNPATGELEGEVAVIAASGRTGNVRRDRKMHANVLESERHPRIVLRLHGFSPALEPGTTGSIDVRGEILLRGDAHAVTVPVEVFTTGNRVQARAEFDVPYVEWGLQDPSTFLLRVSKTVHVVVVLGGTLEETAVNGS